MAFANCTPAALEILSTETVLIHFRCAAWLIPGQVLTTATATLETVTDGTPYPAGLVGVPTVTGTDIHQAVTALQREQRYELAVTFPVDGTTELTAVVVLSCPF